MLILFYIDIYMNYITYYSEIDDYAKFIEELKKINFLYAKYVECKQKKSIFRGLITYNRLPGNTIRKIDDIYAKRDDGNDKNSKYYYTSHNPNKGFLEKWMSDRGFNANYLTPQYFDSFLVNVTCKSRVPLNRKIFSQQEQFKAWGLNVIPQGWSHAVRWGGSFNENYAHQSDGIPNSNDVSCGIGLQARTFSAGDAINCCQSTTGTNSSMGFKWFIR